MDFILALLGLLIFNCVALLGFGTFTNAWITNEHGDGYDVFLLMKNDDSAWIIISSILMRLSLVIFSFLVTSYYIILIVKICRHGYLKVYRNVLYSIIRETGTAFLFTTIALILTAANLSSNGFSFGYSAWICVGAAFNFLAIIGICIHCMKKFDQIPVRLLPSWMQLKLGVEKVVL